MKVGGNESATKFFQRNGGSAALASKDPKTKYTSNAANKYKDELSRRVAVDQKQFPEEVVITDVPDSAAANSSDGTSTPAGEGGEDDFFSSWDKPTIKRPSNPPSRTGTPLSRTASPFLKPGEQNGNGPARPKSPLSASTESTTSPPTTRTTSSAAIRKTATSAAGAKKPNILGAKKKGLGAKKVDASALDFDAAERKAKEEAERIEKLGYNPDEEAAEAATPTTVTSATADKIIAPTPVSPSAGGFGVPKGRERSSSDMERLGMGVGRLGFGQTAGAAKPAPKKPMGFGAVGRAPAQDDSERFAREKFGTQKGISSDEFFGRGTFDANAQSEAKTRLQGFEGATSISSNAYFGRPEDEIPEGGDDLESMAKVILPHPLVLSIVLTDDRILSDVWASQLVMILNRSLRFSERVQIVFEVCSLALS